MYNLLIMSICLFRALYKQFLEEMIIQPGAQHCGNDRKDVTFDDHVSLAMNYEICLTPLPTFPSPIKIEILAKAI